MFEAPDAKTMEKLFTQRLAKASSRLDEAHDRGTRQAAKARAAIARLKRNGVQSKTKFCMRAPGTPGEPGGNGTPVDALDPSSTPSPEEQQQVEA